MESLYELEDELREVITRYACVCRERELDLIDKLNELIAALVTEGL